MVEREESVVLKLLQDWELDFPQTNGTYEIQTTRFKPDSGYVEMSGGGGFRRKFIAFHSLLALYYVVICNGR